MNMIDHRVFHIEDYEEFVGPETVQRVMDKVKDSADLHVVNVNSTYYGGGAAELLSAMSILMNSAGEWGKRPGKP